MSELPADEVSAPDPYTLAEVEFIARLETLQERGDLRRPSEITDDWEQDDHFDDLMRLYRQVCWEMGLPWPPPVRDYKNDEIFSLETGSDTE